MYIYLIRNKINGKVYIGQTNLTVEERFNSHIKKLNKGEGVNPHLVNAWNKYGSDVWEIEQLAECKTQHELDEKEKYYIKKYNSTDRTIGYNIRAGGNGGGLHNKSTKEKIKNKTYMQWERDREKLMEARKRQWTDERRETARKVMLEKWKTAEYVDKQTRSRGSEENREKLRKAAEKNKSKNSDYMKKIWADSGRREKLLKSISLSKTEEGERKRIENVRKAWQDPNLLEAHSKLMKKISEDAEHRDKISKGLSKYFGKVESPTGKIYDVIGIRRFCREHDLNYSTFRNLKYNKNKTYKGWKYIHEDNNLTDS